MILAALLLVAFASVSSAGIIDPAECSASIVDAPAIITIAPGGFQSPIIPDDHTITVYLAGDGEPVEVVRNDIWLDNDDVQFCAGGYIADSSTFAPDAGYTTFTSVPRGGVLPEANCNQDTDVYALGWLIATIPLTFHSQDLNGDGEVTSTDFAQFGSCFNDNPILGHCLCADFDHTLDGQAPDPDVDSVDFAIFASVYNVSECPIIEE
jgi:hypothetical protein